MGKNGKTGWQRFGKKLAKRDEMICHYCGIWVKPCIQMWDEHFDDGYDFIMDHMATADHVIPKIYGGTDDLTNLVIACFPCNTGRGAARPNFKRAVVRHG